MAAGKSIVVHLPLQDASLSLSMTEKREQWQQNILVFVKTINYL